MKETSNVIVVLGGGIDEQGNLREPSQCRVEVAAALFHKNIASNIIVSAKWSYQLNFTPRRTIAETMQAELIKLRVPPKKIILERQSGDTITNIYFTKKLLLDHRWTSVTLVTSPFQMKRATYLCRKIWGPQYRVNFVCSNNGLTGSELLDQAEIEKKLLETTQQKFAEIEDGDDKAIKKLLLKIHPDFNPNIQKSSIWHSKIRSPFHRNTPNNTQTDVSGELPQAKL